MIKKLKNKLIYQIAKYAAYDNKLKFSTYKKICKLIQKTLTRFIFMS